MRFEWDHRKARVNARKHNVEFEEAATAFYDANALIIADPDHSTDEERFILIGLSRQGRVLVVCHRLRAQGNSIRRISARKATAKESQQYWRYCYEA